MASRHYPSIEVLHSWRLILEDEIGHADDLRKYIQRRLQAGKGKAIDEFRVQVQEKANGVFMWIVLVVGILNDEFRRGRIFAVKQRLRAIPPELSELFRDMLQRDHENMDDMLLCLQWVLFAERPLSREEFYYAMEAGLRAEDKGSNVNAQGGHSGNALQAASYYATKEIIQMLLDAGANVRAQGGHYGQALQAAFSTARKEIVRMLIKAGTDVNAQGGFYGNALYAAAGLHHDKEVAQMLINAGADVNALRGYWNHKDDEGYYATALPVASSRGRGASRGRSGRQRL
ncbi:hypothetical protein TI39_contig4126g00008 [Zymoseptoria brevis]|uniref:Uncharacterized protein n=1 Tax=Zymoseptoria brevis TaxID=1047168 RepID=A0A0F4GG92_9PEZI|nr:hypothetical protein TI39_contig4126g00008 [Zymoseptoria brevis]